MHWIFLGIAGVLEIGWMISLKMTQGFTKFVPLIFYAFFGFFSAFFLSKSMKGGIPIAVAYPIWMGIAFVGATIIDIFYFRERYQSIQMIFMALIVVGITGLQIVSRKAEEEKTSATAQSKAWIQSEKS